MIIRKDSPLRRIPSKLNSEQTLFLDAIRYSIEMADASYSRLKRTLLNITKKSQQQINITTLSLYTVKALIDAWSIIDTVHRLRKLLISMPGVKKGAPGRVIFMKNTDEVDSLRNIIQHLNKKTEVENLTQTKSAALGTLTWTVAKDTEPGKIYSCYLRPGTLHTMTAPFVIHTRNIRYPIDNVTLSISSEAVGLSDIMISLTKLASSIEKNLKGQFKDLPPANIDVFICTEINAGEI